ncbi:marvel domain-containing protein [Bombardia bombarda]|uniref:Marvel domain-containing protein n=1 Tax=Bombardia bombarda TaxID=252184 RepID=A0AA39XPN3_9PEZI|nr:marvel domain-containing protein [Bombardia bombarda]
MVAVVSLGLRGLQVIIGAVILGLAVTLIKQQVVNGAPTTTKYSSFTGVFTILVCFIGVAATFIDAIPPIVTMALDGILGLLLLAGGIAWAVGLKGISCKNPVDYLEMLHNGLLNQGSVGSGDDELFGIIPAEGDTHENIFNRLSANCQKGLVDEIFQFIGFGLALVFVALAFVRMRRGGGASNYVV